MNNIAIDTLLDGCVSLKSLWLELPPESVRRLFERKPQNLRTLCIHSWALRKKWQGGMISEDVKEEESAQNDIKLRC